MPAITLAQLEGRIKESYGPDVLQESVFGETEIYQHFDSTADFHMGPTSVKWSVRLQRRWGSGNRDSQQWLPEDSPDVTKWAEESPGRFYLVLGLDKFVMETAKDAAMIVNVVDDSISEAMDSGTQNLDRQCVGDGSGVLGSVGAAGVANSTTIPIAHPFGSTFATPQFFDEGMPIIIGPEGNAPQYTTVTAVDHSANTITVAKNITAAAGTKIALGDDHGNSYAREFKGWRNFIGTGLYASLDGATYRRWRSSVKSFAKKPFDWLELATQVKALEIKAKKTGGLKLWMHPAIMEKYTELVDPDTRYVSTEVRRKKLEEPAIEVGGKLVPVGMSTRCNYGEIVGLGNGAVKKASIRELKWDTDGGMWKQVAGKDASWAYAKMYGQFLAVRRDLMMRVGEYQVNETWVADLHNSL